MHRALILVATAVALGTAVAASTLGSRDAAARAEQATGSCSEPAIAGGTEPQLRPTYPTGEKQLPGPRVVVHYAASGPAAPPPADKTPRNAVPDYVEKVRDAAEAALTFYANPHFRGTPFQGFDTTFTDTGGPDARLDIYVMDTGRVAKGRSAPPTQGEGGAFVMLSQRLADRPRNSRKGDGIRFTVSHEVFHIVQFNYVRAGMPFWVAEGTANTMAFFFEQADRLVQQDADAWLKKPECALWYEGSNCDRCYGGVWLWASYRHVLRLYFDHLARHARDRFGVGTGLGALEAAFDALGANAGGSFVTPYLYTSFAYAFAPAAAMSAVARGKERGPLLMSVVPSSRPVKRRLTLNPMSVHYVGIHVRPGTPALEVVTTGVDDPDPLQTLLLGVSRTRRKTARIEREASPCVATFQPAYATYTDRLTVNFASAGERQRSLLVVANRTNRVVNYDLSYRTVTKAVARPSPSIRSGAKADPKKAFCPDTTRTHGALSDAAGDEELGAPDITDIEVSLMNTAGSTRPLFGFAVGIPNRRELEDDDVFIVWVDTDRNPKTGCDPLGVERAFIVRGLPGPDAYGRGRCVGGELVTEQNQGTFEVRFDEPTRRLVILATAADFQGATSFNFSLGAFWSDPISRETRLDVDGPFCFNCAGTALR